MLTALLLGVLLQQQTPPAAPIPPANPGYEVPAPPYEPPKSVPPGQKPPEQEKPIKPDDPQGKPDKPPGKPGTFPPTQPKPEDKPGGGKPHLQQTGPPPTTLPSPGPVETPGVPAGSPPNTPPTLTDIEQLRLENHGLRVRLAQAEQQLNTLILSQERSKLEMDIRVANPGWTMNWQTGQLEKIQPLTVAPAPPPKK